MSQDQPTASSGNNSDTTASSLEDICRVAIAQSLLTETEINDITQALLSSQSTLTPQSFARQAIQMGKITLFQAKLLLAKDSATLSLGPYLLLDKIGQGGMGSVYKARHKSMDRIVALKVLRRKGGLAPDSIKRFQREVLAAAKLIHPNIVTAFDAGEQNGIHYLVMEYVDAGDLKSLVDQQGPLPVAKALQYVMQAARGLQYAHEKQIIHRDIKPANLLIDQTGCVKILDLGLARIVREQTGEDDHSLTADGALMGTVDFLSPEQSFDTKTADARSDIYSLGCTLYTLLTGEGVFPAGTLVQKILAHRESPAPSVRARRNDVPEAVDVLLQRMLAKNPADRPQSMALVAEALQNILSGNPVTDAAPKITPATTSEDAFLETLIVGGQETVTKDTAQTLPQTTSPTLPQPFVSNVKPKLTVAPVSVSRPKAKKTQGKPWLIGLVGGLVLLLLGGGIGLTFLGSTPKPLILSFNPNQLRDIAGASITIDQQPHGSISPGQDTLEIPTEEGKHTLRVEKQGYEPFSHTYDTASEASLNVAVSLRKKSLPPTPAPSPIPSPTPPKPSPNPADSSAMANNNKPTPPEPVTPPSPTVPAPASTPMPAPTVGDNGRPTTPENTNSKVLVVGLGTGELPDLNTALQQAQPNDTILIKHRGPLDVSPIDLTGKTPLTIIGDQQSGVDFWPIVRQRPISPEESQKIAQDSSAIKPLFYGDKLELQFKKLHLACGGASRAPLESLFRCKSGTIGFEDCTVTASTDEATLFAEGAAIPFIRLEGSRTQHLDLNFTRTLIRGGRLKSLTQISADGSVTISGEQFVWAGGQGNLIELGQGGSRAKLKLKNSTIYNITSVLDIPSYHLTGSDTDNLFDLELDRSIISAREKGTSQFAIISNSENQAIDNNRWQKLLKVASTNSVLTNFDSWLPTTDKLRSISEFRTLLQIDKTELTDTRSRFRVYPAGVELQEVTAQDFDVPQTPSGKGTKKATEAIEVVGAQASELPNVLARISERPVASAEEAVKPRGLPVVIEVSKKNGPIRSLEEAFTKAQGEDVVIQIADSETYIPARNFDVDSKSGVLYTENVAHLTIKAADGETPTIVISDSPQYQVGTVPSLAHWEGTPQLFLFSTRCQSMYFEGLNFVTDISRNMRHSVVLTTATKLRMTNCKILDNSTAAQSYLSFSNGYAVVISYNPSVASEASLPGAAIHWIENVIIEHPLPPVDTVPEHFVTLATAFSVSAGGTSTHILFRNSAVATNHTILFNGAGNTWLEMENCTFHGRLVAMQNAPRSAKVEDCIIFCAPNPVVSLPPGLVDTVNVRGGNNAVWMLNAPLTAQTRNIGPMRWMPGPLLTKQPLLDRNYQLKGRQPASTMATDGGAVGIRLEKLLK